MPTRTIIEWRCTRCGTEEAIEQGRAHRWHMMAGLHGYQGNPKRAKDEPYPNGDICPDCAESFYAWWQQRS